jgi:flagellar motor switch protein FliG
MTTSLPGPQKAALFILGLDEHVAAEVLRHLNEDDLKILATCIESMRPLPAGQLDATFEAFAKQMKEPLLPSSAMTYFRQLAASAIGDERASHLFTPPKEIPTAIELIRAAKPAALSVLLQEEHPQICAVILSQLSKEQAAKVLMEMPSEVRGELVRRLALLKELPEQSVQMASEAVAHTLFVSGAMKQNGSFDGVSFTAGLLNELPKFETEKILAMLETTAVELAPIIRQAMFTFEDLGRLNARALQTLMRSIPADNLLVSLKTASESLREHFLSAVSSRAATSMREELLLLPPMRLSEVERSQREVVEIAMNLAANGQLVLPGSGEKLV